MPKIVHKGKEISRQELLALTKPAKPSQTACIHLGEPLPGLPCGCNAHQCNLFQAPCIPGFAQSLDVKHYCNGCPQRTTHNPVLDNFRLEFQEAVKSAQALTYPAGRFEGRGIVIPAGGWKLLPGVFVAAQFLRWDHVNCRLPIEVWYIGDNGEYDPIFSYITRGLDVTWRDASAELRRLGIDRKEKLHGWALKPLALLLSSFEQVVMMDADCYPVYDPERLWKDPRISAKPAAFWPDNPSHNMGRPLRADQWAAFGLAPVNTPGFESGQMLVDKKRSWAAVNMGAWLSDRMNVIDATRGGPIGIHGDKEIFSISWNATKTPYWMAPPVRFHEVAFLQHDPSGHVAFVHRCQDKPRLTLGTWNTPQKIAKQNFRSATIPHEHMFHHYLDEIRDLLRPPIPGFRDGTQDEQIWREIRLANAYRLPERMDGWRVIDIGAHAGFFTLECLRLGAERVVSVEPFPANVAVARMNLAPWARKCAFIESAVVAPDHGKASMRAGHVYSQTGEPFVADFKGLPGEVEVPTVTLDALIDQCGGQVDLLKIDAEGAEYPALLTATKLGMVDRIAGEYHTCGLPWKPEQLRESLEAAGFTVEMDKNPQIGMFYAWREGFEIVPNPD